MLGLVVEYVVMELELVPLAVLLIVLLFVCESGVAGYSCRLSGESARPMERRRLGVQGVEGVGFKVVTLQFVRL